jgi:NAD+--dinitrogen-reductase ADP-D-ribosyltransferase
MTNSNIGDAGDGLACDNDAGLCKDGDKPFDNPALPSSARLPINRCNLPAIILGGVTFQNQPSPVYIDGIAELHRRLFERLDRIDVVGQRAQIFRDYVSVTFRLDDLEDAGLSERSKKRANANWQRMVRGWSFNSDSREGAVLKGWVESRFGLLPRFHGEPLRDYSEPGYRRYLEMRSAGLYGTNALESQLDLLFSYGQYEYRRQGVLAPLRLYRGINRIGEHEILAKRGRHRYVLLNNLSSFTRTRDRATEFGDYILEADIPVQKIFFHSELLPGVLKGEDECLVIGGVYEVRIRSD